MKRRLIFFLALAPLTRVEGWSYDTVHYLDPVKTAAMTRPVAAAASAERLYVLDEKNSQIFLYDLSGGLLRSVGGRGSAPDSLSSPRGVALGPAGRVYIADTGNSRVVVLDAEGGSAGAFGSKGSEPGRLRSPESVAVGGDGRVYVADTGNDRVQVFTAEGILLYALGGSGAEPGKLKRPSKVAVDPSDNVYVLDAGNERIQKFDPRASFLRQWPMPGNDFAVDPYGFLFLLIPKTGKIVEVSPDGAEGPFGSLGSGLGQFKKPEGVAIGPDGTVFVVDTGNGRIQRVEVPNKLKTAVLPPHLETRLSVSGPSRSWPLPAEALAPYGAELYAYLPKEGQFVLLGEDGGEKARFGTKSGKGPEATRGTLGFAASRKLGLYVSDTPNNRIQRFTLEGEWKANLAESSGMFDSKSKEGRVKDPRGVAVNDQGTVYVADAGNRRIDAFTPEGVFTTAIGPAVGTHQLAEPVAVAWDKARLLFFLDKGLKKVFKTEPSGAFLAAWGEEGEGPGRFREPADLAFDGSNYLYVLDSRLRRVSVFSKDGGWMTDLFSGGRGDNELTEPVALAVQGTRLLVADKGKGKILSFDIHPSLAAPAALSTAAKEGIVSLSWKEVADPWTAAYRVYRSSAPWGPYAELGRAESTRFDDPAAAPDRRHYYRVATEARTGDVGPAGPAAEVFVAAAQNRSPVEISSVSIGNIFSANYKWYLKNPIGTAVVANNLNVPFQNLKLTFKLKDFMDFGYDTELKRLEPRQTVEVPLIATLNNKILDVSEDTPVQAEFSLTYYQDGESRTVSLTKPLRIYSRNAIAWDKPERIANFVTPRDPPVLEFAGEALRRPPESPEAELLNANLVTAMHLWDALSEAGLKFVTNANNPYETVSEDPNFPVDSTQFPRDTLRVKTGQCSDLTTLLVSMLDGVKVRAAIIDFPGHMAPMLDLETDDPEEAGLPEEFLVRYDGSLWAPLEATMIGEPFPEALRKAAYAYKTESAKGKAAVIDVRKAWADFEPATLPRSDAREEVPGPEARRKRFSGEARALAAERARFLKGRLASLLKKNPADAEARLQLGLLEYESGDSAAAEAQFNKVLEADPGNAGALNNLGNVAFLAGDYAGAQKRYLEAAQADSEDPEIWMNLVKTELRLGEAAKAKEYGVKAVALDPDLSPAVQSLLKGQ